jgi:plastocyanin
MRATPFGVIGKNADMTIGNPLRTARALGSAALAFLLVVACASGGGGAWTYAPLGPTQSPGASAGASPGGSPAGSPAGLVLAVVTNEANPLAFDPAQLNAPPATVVTVNYTNNSSLEHNINFFNGPDQNSPSLGATEKVTGPNALRSVTFTTPSQAGDYYFWCDVHLAAMSGHLHVAP